MELYLNVNNMHYRNVSAVSYPCLQDLMLISCSFPIILDLFMCLYYKTSCCIVRLLLLHWSVSSVAQVLSPEMSLATVRTYIWKKPEDLILHYRVVQPRWSRLQMYMLTWFSAWLHHKRCGWRHPWLSEETVRNILLFGSGSRSPRIPTSFASL